MTGLQITRAGPLCTIQDAGRYGFLRFGVTPAGPMDWISFAQANAIIVNQPGAAVVEVGPGGLSVVAEAPQRVAIVAPGFRVLRAGSAVPSVAVMTLPQGMRLDVLPGVSGVWGYLALPGGVAGEAVMGSQATHLRSGLGRAALTLGDRLKGVRDTGETEDRCLILPGKKDDPPIRFVPGPQDGMFAEGALAGVSFRIGARSDRMAYRLNGPSLQAKGGHDIVSDGIAMGAIQVPGDGQPFILMADRQPTGGYPKIGTVIRVDLPRLAQMRAGQELRFQAVTVDAAVAALRTETEAISNLPKRLREMRFL